MKNLTIALADDHPYFIDGLTMTLERMHGMQVVSAAKNGAVLLQHVQRYQPDVVITDIKMPEVDGIEAVKKIREQYPHTGILAMTMFDQDHLIVEILEAGANGYLLKSSGEQELQEAIECANKLKTYFCKSTKQLLSKMIAGSAFRGLNQGIKLNETETTIIQCVCREMTSKEIAGELGCSARTVEGYRRKIQEKIGVKGTAGMVVYGIKAGIYKC
jgi:DNA-binding NarL/FixJ family response regulator